MTDPTRTPSSWRNAPPRVAAPASARSRPAPGGEHDRGHREERYPLAGLSFRDLAAIQIAAAMKGTSRDLSPRETAEIAFELAAALEEERARRPHHGREGDAPPEAGEPVTSGDDEPEAG